MIFKMAIQTISIIIGVVISFFIVMVGALGINFMVEKMGKWFSDDKWNE